ncbi:hypothetical protein ACSQ67_011831 [Phaseolus vulgaris]
MRSPVNSFTSDGFLGKNTVVRNSSTISSIGGSGSYRSGVCVFSYNTTICDEHGKSDHGCGANEQGETDREVYGTRSV